MQIQDSTLIKVQDSDIENGIFTIPNNIITIKSKAFENLNSLQKIIIPKSVETINTRAFYNCPFLKNLEINQENVDILMLGKHYGIFKNFTVIGIYDIYKVDVLLNMKNGNLNLIEQFISLVGDYNGRGSSIGKSILNLTNNLANKSLEERLINVLSKFDKNKKYKSLEYSKIHFILTTSCQVGREEFIEQNNLENWEGFLEDFIELYKKIPNVENVDTICRLMEM